MNITKLGSGSFSRYAKRTILPISSILISLCLLLFSSNASASHFRYGQINWQPDATSDVSFEIQQVWRRDFTSNCRDPNTLASVPCSGVDGYPEDGDFIFTGGFQFGDGAGESVLLEVTSVDPITNSIFGTASITHTYGVLGDYTAFFESCCRIGGFGVGLGQVHVNNPDGGFRVETTVNVGTGNSSPTSTIPSIVVCPEDGDCNFFVPGVDPEDPVTFRLSTPAEADWSSTFSGQQPFTQPVGATINPTTGQYSWDTTGIFKDPLLDTYYSTQVTIEDDQGSKTAVDFLVQLIEEDLSPPFFSGAPGSALVCGTIQNVDVGDPLTFDVYASDNDVGDIVALTVSNLPPSASMSPDLPLGGNPVASVFNWTPASADAGSYVVVFQARSSSGGQALCPVNINVLAQTSDDTARDVPTPAGEDVPVIDIPIFSQNAAEVVVAGSTNADFCLAPDPRERVIVNGSGSQGKGNGKANGANKNGKNGSADVFNKRDLWVSELAGTGTCTGLLEFPDDDPDTPDTWEGLLANIDLVIASRYRGYVGKVDLTPEDNDPSDSVEAVWLVVGVVRSSAEYNGPVSMVGFPDTLIDYNDTPLAETPACDRASDWRSLDLGGTVAAFDEVPNVEGNTMIVETVQCNAPWSMTRRTTHVYPVRLDGPGGSSGKENENLSTLLDGIQGTLDEASYCAAPALIADMQQSLDNANDAIQAKDYEDAIDWFEQIAFAADDSPEGFDNCTVPADDYYPNYYGNFVARGLTAAFTIWDRYIHADLEDNVPVYPLPARFADLKPDLRE